MSNWLVEYKRRNRLHLTEIPPEVISEEVAQDNARAMLPSDCKVTAVVRADSKEADHLRRKHKAAQARRGRDEAYRSCGMTKTRYGWE